MDILTIIIAVCSCLNLILLCIVLAGRNKTKNVNDKLLELKKTIDTESREHDKSIAVIQTTLQHNEALIKSIESSFSELKADVLQKMNDINVSNADSITKLMKENSEHFDKLNGTLISSIDKLRTENKESLDKINGTVNEKLQDTLDKKINESFRTVNEQLISISKGLGEMQSVASNVTDLKKVLSNVKTRGNFGEVQLEAILQDILTPDQYVKQADIIGNGTLVDFAIRFPGTDNTPVYLPIDSKFPGDSYEALVDAINTGNRDEIERCRKNLQNVIKAEAKSIHDKYISPPVTMDFAIMFLSSEGLYSEIVSTAGLVAELQTMHINIAGPSTMSAMLNSFRIGF
ncbi:MAG: DNA recombination protein RmuC, partial [Ruminiclostridium sp.]|nr:DNA recombination protein RmuC [Ruminiclostridium sp.]